MKIAVAIRTCGLVYSYWKNSNNRIVDVDKETIVLTCLNSLLKSIKSSKHEIVFSIHDDSSSDKTLNVIGKLCEKYGIKGELINSGKLGNFKSQYEWVKKQECDYVYCVGEKNKKILRVSKRLPLDDVKFEFEAMEHLFKSGVPVPAWIKTREGAFYASTPEIPTAVLFEFLDGVHAERINEKMPTITQSYEAGKALAELHNTGQDFKSNSPRSRDIFSELNRVIANADIFVKDFDGGQKFVDEVKEAVEFAKNNPEPKGFIHNDYRVGNVFFKKDNPEKILGIIDFDWGCVGPLSKDFALGVVEWSFDSGALEPNLEIFAAFLEGYNSTAKYKQEKDNKLYTWIWFSGLSDTATWLCDNLATPDFIKRVNRSHMYQKAQYFKALVK